MGEHGNPRGGGVVVGEHERGLGGQLEQAIPAALNNPGGSLLGKPFAYETLGHACLQPRRGQRSLTGHRAIQAQLVPNVNH
jgi:hypothetical protein